MFPHCVSEKINDKKVTEISLYDVISKWNLIKGREAEYHRFISNWPLRVLSSPQPILFNRTQCVWPDVWFIWRVWMQHSRWGQSSKQPDCAPQEKVLHTWAGLKTKQYLTQNHGHKEHWIMGGSIFTSRAQWRIRLCQKRRQAGWQGGRTAAELTAVCYPVPNHGQVRKIGGDINVKL